MSKVILVLDKLDYKKDYYEHLKLLKHHYKSAEIVYTEYEDRFIRKTRNWRYVGNVLRHILYWIKSLNYAKKISKNAKKDRTTIICINPIVGMFLGMLNKNKMYKIILCGFLFEEKENKLYYFLRKKFTKACIKNISKLVVYTKNEEAYYSNLFAQKGKFIFLAYGIDYDTSESYKGLLPKEFIFSGGGSNRDYITLVKAYQLITNEIKIPLVIATLPECVKGIDTQTIHILHDVVLETFGDVLKKSLFLVLSLKEAEISTGHMVLLQALKENVPILVNRISAIEDYVSEENVIFYESGNIKDLGDKIKTIINNKNQEIKCNCNDLFYYENYRFSNLLERLLMLPK